MKKIISPKTAAIIFSGILALSVAGVWIYWISKELSEIAPYEPPQTQTRVFTPEEIEKALSKKTTTTAKTISEQQIDKALNEKVPAGERPEPLTAEEIQKALEAK